MVTIKKKKSIGLFLAAIVIVLALTTFLPSVSAIEVHPGGSIQDAINTAVSGQTIIVHNGDYRENIIVNKSNIVIRSANGSSVTFITSNETDKHVVTISDQTNVTLDNFTIRDAYGSSNDIAGIYMNNTNKCTISNNTITNISAAVSRDANGIWIDQSDNNSFSSNTVFNLTNAPYSYGIHLYGSDNNSFSSSTSVSNITATTFACGILLGNSSSNKFNAITTLSRITAYGGAGGIVLEDGSDDNTFSASFISHITAPLYDAGGIVLSTSSNNTFTSSDISLINATQDAGGIALTTSNGNAFTSITISRITAVRDAGGMVLDTSNDNTFTAGTITYINATRDAGGIALTTSTGNTFTNITVSYVAVSQFWGAVVPIGQSAAGSGALNLSLTLLPENTACGLLMVLSDNNAFTDTDISHIYASMVERVTDLLSDGGYDATNLSVNVSTDNTACGMWLLLSNNNTFTNSAVSYIGARKLDVGDTIIIRSDGGYDLTNLSASITTDNTACGIWLLVSNENTFTDTDVSHINASLVHGGIIVGQSNIVGQSDGEVTDLSVYGTVVNTAGGIWLAVANDNGFTNTEVSYIDVYQEEALSPLSDKVGATLAFGFYSNGWAFGIWLAAANNNSFTTTAVTNLSSDLVVTGIELMVSNENEFHDWSMSDFNSGSSDTTYGVDLAFCEQNVLSNGRIFRGAGPMLDFGVLMAFCSENVIQDCEIFDCRVGIQLDFEANGNEFVRNTIEDNLDGIVVVESNNNTIEANMIRNNKGGVHTGVHVDASSDENGIHGNCFFYNEPYQAWDDFSAGDSNHWDGNYWEPEPGEEPGNPFLIPGAAGSRDSTPLGYCPLCPAQVPALMPLGIVALVGLLSAIAALALVRKRR